MPTSSAANGVEYAVSQRRSSLKDSGMQSRKTVRRSSSSQEIANQNVTGGNSLKDEEQTADKNQNFLAVKPGRRRMGRRRSSTSGTLLSRNEADQTAKNNGSLSARYGRPTSPSNPSSPRRGSNVSCPPQQQASLSPRRNSGMKFTRRNSSHSASIMSPTNRPDTYFEFPPSRSESFEYTKSKFIKGGLIMSSKCSVRGLEYLNEKEKEEKEEIDDKLKKFNEEKKHVEILENAVSEWIALLKDIHRLSKGVPLMRSITKVCLAMNDIFQSKGGAYGASLLALRRCGLSTINFVSSDMEKLRSKIEKGGLELSLVDGKFLEDIREILGRIEGTLAVTLKMFY